MSGWALTARHVFPGHPFSRSQDLPISRSPSAGQSAPTYPVSERRTPLQRHLQVERAWRSDSHRCSRSKRGSSRTPGEVCSSAPPAPPTFLDGAWPSLAAPAHKSPSQPGPKPKPCVVRAAGALTFPVLQLHFKRPSAPGRLFLGSSEVTLGPRSADSRE